MATIQGNADAPEPDTAVSVAWQVHTIESASNHQIRVTGSEVLEHHQWIH